MSNPFEYLNSINGDKKNLIRNSDSREAAEKLYNKFLTARSLSYHSDTVGIVNELNIHGTAAHGITGLMHFEFLLHTIPKGRRFAKWLKPEVEQKIDLIMQIHKYSYSKARQVVDLFSDGDYERMQLSLERGGAAK